MDKQQIYLNQQLYFKPHTFIKSPFSVIQQISFRNRHDSYYIESQGEAVVIDPLRDINQYLDLQTQTNSAIKYVILTHIPSDYLGGHYDLATSTGAKIMFGAGVKAEFDCQNLKDEQEINLGIITLKVMHTPGHTPEHISLLLIDQNKKPYCVFTGDTLLIGDTGKPDPIQCPDPNAANKQLYASLQKLIKLPEDVFVYPGHGPNHHCGLKVKKSIFCNKLKCVIELDENLKLSEQDYITQVKPQPQFPFMKEMVQNNLKKVEKFDVLLKKCLNPIPLSQFIVDKKQCMVLDTRWKEKFMEESIPDTININIYKMNFELWASRLIPSNQKILLITEPNSELETTTRLLRIGIENIAGFLEGGIEGWKANKHPTIKGQYIPAINLKDDDLKGKFIVDARNPPEFAEGHVMGAVNYPLPALEENLKKNKDFLPRDKDIYVICLGGDRATIYTSILRNYGYTRIINLMGGYEKIKEKNNLTLVK